MKAIGFLEPEIIERDEHLVVLSFEFIVQVISVRRFIRPWCVRLFRVIRLKSSEEGRVIM